MSTTHGKVNPLVGYLHSLRTQSDGGNPGYVEEIRRPAIERLRAEHPWFPSIDELHVPTRLDALVDHIASGDVGFDLVILTGDAGDGKTAVCTRIAARLGHAGELKPVEVLGRWTILKDASELTETALLHHVTRALDGGDCGLVLAINEGRLRRLALRSSQYPPATRVRLEQLWRDVLEPSLRSDLVAEEARALQDAMRSQRVAVVNFRHRMHVRTVTPGLLRVWSQPALWEGSPACGGCDVRESCTILANVRDVRREDVQERIADSLTAAHYAGQRLPFRRLQAVLALGVTGGLHCEDLAAGGRLHGDEMRLKRLRHRYYDVLFPQEARRIVPVRAEPVTKVLAATDPGALSEDRIDAEINALAAALHREGDVPSLAGEPLGPIELAALAQVRVWMGASLATHDAAPGDALAELTRALRRWGALRGAAPDTSWRRALGLLEGFATGGEAETLRSAVVGALNTLQRLGATNEAQLTGRQVDPMGFRDPDRLDLELDLGTSFDVALRRGPIVPDSVGRWLESSASEIELEAWPAGAASGSRERLRIDLALMTALLSASEGYTLVYALGPYRRDLARFFSRLAARAHEAGHRAHVSLRVDGKSYRVTATVTGGVPRLSFEGQG